MSPLIIRQEIVRCLLREEVECDISLKNNDGESALDLVDTSSGESEVILILLREKQQSGGA